MPYFSPEPKSNIEDFFNMEEELQLFLEALKYGRFIVVSGLRRYGKTSLILTGLSKARQAYIFIDCRLLPQGKISINSFMELLEEELSRRSWARGVLRGVEGISIGSFGVRFRERSKGCLLSLLENLDGRVLVLDEAQELRRMGHRLDSILAYVYDHQKLKVVVSGSQVGLLHRFLRLHEPDAPLFGRPYIEVRLRKLEMEKAREFLMKGFEQEGVKMPQEVIEEALKRFDGIIGWLTYFGYASTRTREPIEGIFERASRLAAEEVSNALKIYGVAEPRYKEALKVVSNLGNARWIEIKRGIESRLGRIPNNTLSTIIGNLVDQGLIEKIDETYRPCDPIVRKGILKFL